MEDGELNDTRQRTYSNSGNNNDRGNHQQRRGGGGGRWPPRDNRRDRYDNRNRHDSRDTYHSNRRDSFDRRGNSSGSFNNSRYNRGPPRDMGPNEFRRSYSDQPMSRSHPNPPPQRIPLGSGRKHSNSQQSWGNSAPSPSLRRVTSEPVWSGSNRNSGVPPPPPPPPLHKPPPPSAPPPPPRPLANIRSSNMGNGNRPKKIPLGSPSSSGSMHNSSILHRATTPRLEPPPSPMVAADKEKKEKLLKIMDALDLAVNRAESNLEALELQKEKIEKELNVEAEEDDDGYDEKKNTEAEPPTVQDEILTQPTKAEQEKTYDMEIAKKIKAHRNKMLKKVIPIGEIVEKVKEENRMRAFAARVGLMKISITPGPGVPNKKHLVGGPHIPKEMTYEDLLDTNDVPLYQSPMETPQWAYNEARHNQIFSYILGAVATRKAGVAYHGRAMRKTYDIALEKWKKRVEHIEQTERMIQMAKTGQISLDSATGNSTMSSNSSTNNSKTSGNSALGNTSMPPPVTPGGNLAKTTRLTRNTSADIVNSDAEMLQKIKELEEEEMRKEQFRKTLADIPSMIFDRRERRSKMMLSNTNGLVYDVIQDEKEQRLKNPWSDVEKLIFLEKFLQYPKEFWKIAKYLKNKSTNDVVSFYYNTKHQMDYKNYLKQHMGIRARQRAGKDVDGDEVRYGPLSLNKIGKPPKKQKETTGGGRWPKKRPLSSPSLRKGGGSPRDIDAQLLADKAQNQPELLRSSVWALIREMASKMGIKIPAYGSNPIISGGGAEGLKSSCMALSDLASDSKYSEWPEDHWSRFMPIPYDFQQQPLANERFKEEPKWSDCKWIRLETNPIYDQPLDYYQYRLITAARCCAKPNTRQVSNVMQTLAMVNVRWRGQMEESIKLRRKELNRRRVEILRQAHNMRQAANRRNQLGKRGRGRGRGRGGGGGGRRIGSKKLAKSKFNNKSLKKPKKLKKKKRLKPGPKPKKKKPDKPLKKKTYKKRKRDDSDSDSDASGSDDSDSDDDYSRKKKKSKKGFAIDKKLVIKGPASNKWTQQEKDMFLIHLRSFGKDWPRIQTYIRTKTHAQIRNFYQNYKYKLDLPGILQRRENDLAKKKKKEERETKKGKRKHKEMLKEQKRLKKIQKQQESERQEEQRRKQEAKAKKHRITSKSSDGGTPLNNNNANKKNGVLTTGKRGVGRPPNSSNNGISGPRPASIDAKSASRIGNNGLSLAKTPGSPLGATPRALKEVRRLFHTGRITPKTSPDGVAVTGIKNTIGGSNSVSDGSSLNPNKKK
jgi:hypothetical protein